VWVFILTRGPRHDYWRVAQIFNALGQMYSAVEHLALKHKVHGQSSEEPDKVNRTVWHSFFVFF
jgi:hypothetical protein